jgi:hypothetical protein
MSELELIIDKVTGYKNSRLEAAEFVLSHPNLLEELLQVCFALENQNHYKACWILELIALEKLVLLQPHLEIICSKTKSLTNESAIRTISKVIFLLIQENFKKTDKTIYLNESQLQNLVEINFDWLITKTKVASKVYAMRCLYFLGKEYDWIHTELKTILVKDFSTHTAAYKAVSKHILKKL